MNNHSYKKAISAGIMILSLCNVACSSDKTDIENNKNKLVSFVTCQQNTTPTQFTQTISDAGGKSIISGNMGDAIDTIYSLPTPVNLWGYPVSSFTMHRGSNSDGDYDEFAAVVPTDSNQVTSDDVAALGKVRRISENYFMNEVGGNDLIVRQYEDTVYVSCANNVRTIKKNFDRNVKQLREKLGG